MGTLDVPNLICHGPSCLLEDPCDIVVLWHLQLLCHLQSNPVVFPGNFGTHCALLVDFSLQLAGCCGSFQMSESSSDTTHEAILHNLVAHNRTIQRQIGALSQDIQDLRNQITVLTSLVQRLVGPARPREDPAEADGGTGHNDNPAQSWFESQQ